MDNAVSVDYATADGTAHAGEDYVATSGTLTFAAHERAKTVDVTVLADQAADGDETFTLNLSNESSGTMVDNQAVVTILAPHPPPPPPPFTPPKCVVPNVLHLKLAKAKARIRARHCRIGKVSKRHSSRVNRGRVIKQIPKATSRKRPNGFKVRLTVGK
jgi:Calx-beta domain/PASTA domain